MHLENSNVQVTSELVKQKLLNESAKRESKQLVHASNARIVKPHKTVAKILFAIITKSLDPRDWFAHCIKKENRKGKEKIRKLFMW